MFRKLQLITLEVIIAAFLLSCWLFANAQLPLIALSCIALLISRRLGDMRQHASQRLLIRELESAQHQLVCVSRLDRLTGLLNRHALISNLQSMLKPDRARDRNLTLLFLDFDRFKIVNDSLGHEIGDQLLVNIGQRLQTFVNSSGVGVQKDFKNLAARLGGDEFVLVLEQHSEEDVLRDVESLAAVLAEPYYLGETQVSSTASIGIVVNHGKYTDANEMIRDADVAMYEAKGVGRGSYLVFDTPMRERVQRRQQLEVNLARAIERQELRLVYQPIVCVHTGHLKSMEALMRWRHPQDGHISPAEFIPIAEESGLIHKLFDWAIFESCRQLLTWANSIEVAPTCSFSLNLSPRQFNDATLAHRVQQTIEDAGIDPTLIVFELTESVLMSDPKEALRILETIKRYGSRIALDDFGIGHSSLASLHRFPVDFLKFDRSFIKDIDKDRNLASMVHSISVLARNLGIVTVAEGIETPEQFVAVRELGCDLAQGYLIAKPLSAEDFVDFAMNRESKLPTATAANVFKGRWENSIELMT